MDKEISNKPSISTALLPDQYVYQIGYVACLRDTFYQASPNQATFLNFSFVEFSSRGLKLVQVASCFLGNLQGASKKRTPYEKLIDIFRFVLFDWNFQHLCIFYQRKYLQSYCIIQESPMFDDFKNVIQIPVTS